MEVKIKNLIHEAEQKIKILFGKKLSKIILYGSYARGDHNNWSDIDIIALVDDDDLNRFDKQILRISVDLSIEYDVDLSIFIESESTFDENVDVIPLFKNINKEGINIYAA